MLSKLKLEPQEEEELASQLEQILEYFELLAGYKTVDTDLKMALDPDDLRPDVPESSFTRETLQSFAVELQDGHLVVPRILEKHDE